jgi:hypothetical protein
MDVDFAVDEIDPTSSPLKTHPETKEFVDGNN